MAQLDFISPVHKKTKRDYLGRVNAYPKAEAAVKFILKAGSDEPANWSFSWADG